ncbi:hypothetical protein C9374_003513 [Naegleria lovaniensis]|uniref:Uncharacterized protein n=1 Tax=Naegleria lovaniensis TaxID=51637 RepID=A0AA88GT00_NAELO|nr:uncharacterized protein C9374_003513 [Naegleria lovaniensis]KAG2385698.1 hypothetical protein C9374_003513 [Naegleria lovaniensis]
MVIQYSKTVKVHNETKKFIHYNNTYFTQPSKKQKLKDDVSKRSTRGITKTTRIGIVGKFRKRRWVKTVEAHQKRVDIIVNFVANPVPREEFWKCLERVNQNLQKPFMSFCDMMLYLERRWNEFCAEAYATLKANLQPGGMKFGSSLNLGRFPYAVLDWILCRNYQCKKEVVETSININREEVPVRVFKYSFMSETGLPKLGNDSFWYMNLHFPTEKQPTFQKSEYTSLTIVVNDYDNRVYCNWEMVNYVMWIDRDGMSGRWTKTT